MLHTLRRRVGIICLTLEHCVITGLWVFIDMCFRRTPDVEVVRATRGNSCNPNHYNKGYDA